MAEKLYTIPVNDAFHKNSECPLCSMYQRLESDAVEFMVGPSYMEDDIRMETDEKGFCDRHMGALLAKKNRLGIALILKTHLDRQIAETERLAKKPIKPLSLLKKEPSEIAKYAGDTHKKCYLCDRIGLTFPHYVDTVVKLYKRDEAFRDLYQRSKGFCYEHFSQLIESARANFSGETLREFVDTTVTLYTENLKRVADDLEWFTRKFDYRYKDEPWKDSKDAIERAVIKTNGIMPEENK